ncbi:hypothetical protein JAAARDRAFT_241650 [Jaapia argillacea MUCL 33604]|uniref:Uncharacterized protein n=1 Tax=Jaapia argillacea MUCL 33604 TaxID=933084 RepID=A0A067QMZ4_9AGAM|nr:hypothetical protein JAAARDRAFT_241650 [Jaapia argillacea MUCL 33604]
MSLRLTGEQLPLTSFLSGSRRNTKENTPIRGRNKRRRDDDEGVEGELPSKKGKGKTRPPLAETVAPNVTKKRKQDTPQVNSVKDLLVASSSKRTNTAHSTSIRPGPLRVVPAEPTPSGPVEPDVIDLTALSSSDIEFEPVSTSRAPLTIARQLRAPLVGGAFPTPPPTVPPLQKHPSRPELSSPPKSPPNRPRTNLVRRVVRPPAVILPTPQSPVRRRGGAARPSHLGKLTFGPRTPTKSPSRSTPRKGRTGQRSSPAVPGTPTPARYRLAVRSSSPIDMLKAPDFGSPSREVVAPSDAGEIDVIIPGDDVDPFVVPSSQAIVPSSQTFEMLCPPPSSGLHHDSSALERPVLASFSTFALVMELPSSAEFVPSSQTQELLMPTMSPPAGKSVSIPLRNSSPNRMPLTAKETLRAEFSHLPPPRRPLTLMGPPSLIITSSEIIPSSQSQTEKELVVQPPLPQNNPSQHVNPTAATQGSFTQVSSCVPSQPSTPLAVPLTKPPPLKVVRGSPSVHTPPTHTSSQSLTQMFTSPPRITSSYRDAHSKLGPSSNLPTPLRAFRDMFDSEPSWMASSQPAPGGRQEDSANGASKIPSLQKRPAEDDDSCTEPESDDVMAAPLAVAAARTTVITTAFAQESVKRSLQHSPTLLGAESQAGYSLPSASQDFGDGSSFYRGATPLTLPSESMYGSHAPIRPRLSFRSFPSVAKDFRDMFEGDGSFPDDFPESLSRTALSGELNLAVIPVCSPCYTLHVTCHIQCRSRAAFVSKAHTGQAAGAPIPVVYLTLSRALCDRIFSLVWVLFLFLPFTMDVARYVICDN